MRRVVRLRRTVGVGVGAAALGLLVAAGVAAAALGTGIGPGGVPTVGPSDPSLTASQLATYLRQAASITKVPPDLTPSLSQPHTWGSLIVEDGCQLSRADEVQSPPCVFGDSTGRTNVVLFGDSHAGMWFPALDQISIQRHWRLLIFTKAGCSPPEVKLYAQCNTWRHNSEAQIAAIHPAIVIVSWARWIAHESKPLAGVPTGYGSAWLDGIAAIFKFLSRSAGRVIFISDGPTLDFGGAKCVARHLIDVHPCNTTPRSKGIFLPRVRAAEFELAYRLHISSIDPTPWFCSATACPVVVRNFLVYYDSSHVTPPYSGFLAPVLDKALTSILARPRGASVS